MTRELFREDSYLRSCDATITGIHDAGVETDQSVFYPLGGGQQGDTGWLIAVDGTRVDITDTLKDRESDKHLHVIADNSMLSVGDTISLVLDWDRRHRLMRFHSCLHMLCSADRCTGNQWFHSGGPSPP